MYKLIKDFNGVRKIPENKDIPNCPYNKDWKEYQAWLAEGHNPEPAEE